MTTQAPVTIRAPRPAARLLVLDPQERILLFRFSPLDGGAAFWATPGGALDPGESYAAAARRELQEETGFTCEVGPEVARRHVEFTTLEGVEVQADERYFVVRPADCTLDFAGHTDLEKQVMQAHHWWTREELAATDAIYFPEELLDLWADVAGVKL